MKHIATTHERYVYKTTYMQVHRPAYMAHNEIRSRTRKVKKSSQSSMFLGGWVVCGGGVVWRVGCL